MEKPKFELGQEVDVRMFGTIKTITICDGMKNGEVVKTLQYTVVYNRADGKPGDMAFVLEDSLCKLPQEG